MYKYVLSIACVVLIASSVFPATAQNCLTSTPELAHMEVREALLNGPDSRRIALAVHIADDGNERAAGFQQICPQVAEHTAILFLFERTHIPSFHMSNVHMPLDIAFIDAAGIIRDIQTMSPYIIGKQSQKRLWSPPTPVRAALEVKAGLFSELGITPDDWSVAVSK